MSDMHRSCTTGVAQTTDAKSMPHWKCFPDERGVSIIYKSAVCIITE